MSSLTIPSPHPFQRCPHGFLVLCRATRLLREAEVLRQHIEPRLFTGFIQLSEHIDPMKSVTSEIQTHGTYLNPAVLA